MSKFQAADQHPVTHSGNQWNSIPFEEAIEKITYTNKIQRSEFLADGSYPIVSQEEGLINGYWNQPADVFKTTRPLTVFGDHTQTLKYVDFDFVLGADGVKILQSKSFLLPKFFHYQLQGLTLKNLGYARHYRLLKEKQVVYPSQPEQGRIVAVLDEAFEELDRVRANCARTLQMAGSLLNGEVNYLFSKGRTGWTQTTVGSQLTLQRGFDITKDHQTQGRVPVVSSGGIRSFHNQSMCFSPGVVIGRKGTLGKVFYVEVDYWPHDTTLWVKDFKGNNPKLIYYLFRGLDVKQFDSGAANPALNRNQVHPIKIWWPPPKEQASLVSQLDEMANGAQHLESIYSRKLSALDSLKQSLLHQAFSGNL